MWFKLDVSCLSRTNYLGYMLTKREQSACLESLGGIKSCAVTAGCSSVLSTTTSSQLPSGVLQPCVQAEP